MKKNIIVASAISIVCTAILGIFLHMQQRKIAVVDAITLYNQFKMTKDLETHNGKDIQALTQSVDSLKGALQVKSSDKNIPEQEIRELYGHYMKAQQLLDTRFQELNNEINIQVWKRLNPLIDDYGKSNGLRLIIGANGMGTVLYNDDFYDHTQEIIKYVNKRYESGN